MNRYCLAYSKGLRGWIKDLLPVLVLLAIVTLHIGNLMWVNNIETSTKGMEYLYYLHYVILFAIPILPVLDVFFEYLKNKFSIDEIEINGVRYVRKR